MGAQTFLLSFDTLQVDKALSYLSLRSLHPTEDDDMHRSVRYSDITGGHVSNSLVPPNSSPVPSSFISSTITSSCTK